MTSLLTMWPRFGVLAEDMEVDEFVEGEELVLRADLPGVDPDRDVEITVADGRLTIKAERRQEERTEGRDYVRREVRYGSFQRSLPLPAGATEADVKATYKDGVLEVRTPFAKEPTATKVAITRG